MDVPGPAPWLTCAGRSDMSHRLTYDPDSDCLVLRIRGKVTIELIRELAPQVGRMFEETGCRRLLNDMSAATIDISVTDLFTSPKIMDDSGVGRNTRRALVVSREFEESGFLENVTRNRGHNFRAFVNIKEAKQWLLSGE